MKRVLAVLTLGAVLGASLQRPEPAAANPAAVRAAIAACGAQPEACAIVGAAAGTWILWNSGAKFWCTVGQCQATRQAPGIPRENRVQNGDENIPGQVESHLVMSKAKCKEMYERHKNEGAGLTSWFFDPRQRMAGVRGSGLCKLYGPGARDDRFHDHRYDSSY